MPTVERDGASLYYRVIDETPPWVPAPETIIIHHGVGIDSDIWRNWLGAIVPRYRAVLLDMRGFGRSTVPPPDHAWSMDGLMADALAVADAAGAERFHFVGESLGGTLGLSLAIHHADRLLSVTAASTAHRGGLIHHVGEWRAFIAEHGMARWSEVMMERRFHPDALPSSVHAWFHEVQSACSEDAVLGLAELLVGTDLTEELVRIRTPVLLLAGDRSPFVPLAITNEIHQRVAHAELQVFPHARHGLVCSHAAACAETLVAFLDRHGDG